MSKSEGTPDPGILERPCVKFALSGALAFSRHTSPLFFLSPFFCATPQLTEEASNLKVLLLICCSLFVCVLFHVLFVIIIEQCGGCW